MSNLASLSSNHTASGAHPLLTGLAPAALVLVSSLGLLAAGCGGGPAYVAAGPCYGYGCGYGYGYGMGKISTVVGIGTPGIPGNGTPAVQAPLKQPVALAFDPSGNLYIADRASNSVREVASSTGVLDSASAGNASADPGSRSSLAKSAVDVRVNHPSAVAVDPSGNVYVLDQASSTVRRLSAATGALAIVAGNLTGRSGYSGDNGQATSAQLNRPLGMAFDPSGNLYIADTFNNRIRKVAAFSGIITTVAGDGTAGYSGDGGAAAAAQLSHPAGIAADSKGNLYIADTTNSAIRKVDGRSGMISTVAGTGVAGFSGDSGAAVAAQISEPQGISVDVYGNLFIADTGNQRIREVAARSGNISTVAGDRNQGYAGDGGPSSLAELNNPYATAIDASGNLYIADSGNGVIRKALPNPQTAAKAN